MKKYVNIFSKIKYVVFALILLCSFFVVGWLYAINFSSTPNEPNNLNNQNLNINQSLDNKNLAPNQTINNSQKITAENTVTQKQDSTHMVYFAVYYLSSRPLNDGADWTFFPYVAPQTSTDGMEFNSLTASLAPTACKMTYAGKEFYLYNEGVIAHNTEYITDRTMMTNSVDAPQVEVLSTSMGYEYIGYASKRELTYKYSNTTKLPSVKNQKNLDSTECKSKIANNFMDKQYCITISVYFYRPGSLTLKSNQPENGGRFSEKSSTSFSAAQKEIKISGLQASQIVRLEPLQPDTKKVVTVSGVEKYIHNSTRQERAIYKQYYVIMQPGWKLADRTDKATTIKIDDATPYEQTFYFAIQTDNISITINSFVQTSDEILIDIGFGIFHKKVWLKGGKNVYTTVTLENIPSSYTGSIMVSYSKNLSKNNRLVALSSEPLTKVENNTKLNTFIDITTTKTLSDTIAEGSHICYIYEVFPINVDFMTNKIRDKNLTVYRFVDEPFDINSVKYATKVDGFNICGFSLEPNSTTAVATIEPNTTQNIYAIWKKTLSATLYAFNTPTVITKDVYNFDTLDSVEVTNLPSYASDVTLVGYTTNQENPKNENIIQVNVGDSLANGAVLYSVFQVALTLTFDLDCSGYDEDMAQKLNIDKTATTNSITVNAYKTKYGVKSVGVEMPTITFDDTHYIFHGWSRMEREWIDWMEEWCYLPGEELRLWEDDTIYPIFESKKYDLKINLNGGIYNQTPTPGGVYNELDDSVTFKLAHHEKVTFYTDTFTRIGYKAPRGVVANNPENLKDGTYSNISQNEVINTVWEYQPYKVSLSVGSATESGVSLSECNLTLKYSYFDLLTQTNVSGEIVPKTNDVIGNIVIGTTINFEASITKDNHSIRIDDYFPNDLKKVVKHTFVFDSTKANRDYVVNLGVYRMYAVTLKNIDGVGGQNVIYRPKKRPTDLPVKGIYSESGDALKAWRFEDTSLPHSTSNVSYIPDSIEYDRDLTMVAVWYPAVKFYIYDAEKPHGEYYQVSSPYNPYNFFDYWTYPQYPSRVYEGKTYYIEGWAKTPNSLEIAWNGKTRIPFEGNCSWYAVFATRETEKVITETVTAKFHRTSDVVEQSVTRTVYYKNYPILADLSFNIFDDTKYIKAGKMANSGTVEYKNNEVEFVEGMGRRRDGSSYPIYAWSETGDFQYITYYKKGEKIPVCEELDFYPILREGSKEQQVTHEFHVMKSAEEYSVITVTSNIYVFNSNSFFIYNGYNGKTGSSNSTSISDPDLVVETTGETIAYPVDVDDPKNRCYIINFIGWTDGISSTYVDWPKGEKKELTTATTWYSLKKEFNTTFYDSPLTHTIILNENERVTFTTTKTTYRNNYFTTTSYDRRITTRLTDGEITYKYSSIKIEDIEKLITNLRQNYTLFACIEEGETLKSKHDGTLTPTKNTTYYAIYKARVYTRLIYYYKDKKVKDYLCTNNYDVLVDINDNIHKWDPIYTGKVSEYINMSESYEQQTDFLGWYNPNDDSDVRYFNKDYIYYKNLKYDLELGCLYGEITLYADIKQPEVVQVTFVLNGSTVESNYLENEEIVLEEPMEVEGKQFTHWLCDNKVYKVGDAFKASNNSKIVAVYKSLLDSDHEDNPSVDNNPGDSSNTNADNNNPTVVTNEKEPVSALPLILCITIPLLVVSAAAVTFAILKVKTKGKKRKH